jgi:5-methylcytosine-specific restriction protein A
MSGAASQKLFKSARWQKRRARQLRDRPLCERHLKMNQVVVATTAHHLTRHKGNAEIFWSSPLESLCESCHNQDAQEEEADAVRGYSTRIGLDGWPTDPRHPANRGSS